MNEIRAASGEKNETTGGEICAGRTLSEAPADVSSRNSNAEGNDAGVGDPMGTSGGEPSDCIGDEQANDEGGQALECGEEEGSGQAAGEEGEQGRVSSEEGSLDRGGTLMVPPLVVTGITVVTFREGEKVWW